MVEHSWVKEFPGAVLVCDAEGVLLEMNDRGAAAFDDQGGRRLIGTNLLDCHPEPSRTRFEQLLRTRTTNVYTIEKGGVWKLVYQAPWYRDGQYAGLIELSLEIPQSIPHFIRDVVK